MTAGSVVDCGSRGGRGARRSQRAGRSLSRVCSHDAGQRRATTAHALLAGGKRSRSLRGLLSLLTSTVCAYSYCAVCPYSYLVRCFETSFAYVYAYEYSYPYLVRTSKLVFHYLRVCTSTGTSTYSTLYAVVVSSLVLSLSCLVLSCLVLSSLFLSSLFLSCLVFSSLLFSPSYSYYSLLEIRV